jgi:hypothetical protein
VSTTILFSASRVLSVKNLVGHLKVDDLGNACFDFASAKVDAFGSARFGASDDDTITGALCIQKGNGTSSNFLFASQALKCALNKIGDT